MSLQERPCDGKICDGRLKWLATDQLLLMLSFILSTTGSTALFLIIVHVPPVLFELPTPLSGAVRLRGVVTGLSEWPLMYYGKQLTFTEFAQRRLC